MQCSLSIFARAVTASVSLCVHLPAVAGAPEQPRLFDGAARASEEALGSMRGGVLLPNGLDVAIGLDIQTRVNGELALHTVVSTESVAPRGVRVLVDGRQRSEMPAPITVMPVANAGQILILDRRGSSTTLQPSTTWTPPATVFVLNAPREVWPRFAGETDLQIQANGAAVATDLGAVQLDQTEQGSIVTLRSDTLLIQHLIGDATGIVVANTANNQTIDTVSAINVDLQGAWPVLTNAMFNINAIAVDVASRN